MLSSMTDNATHAIDHVVQEAGAKLLLTVVEQTHDRDIIKTLCNSTTAPENVILAAARAWKVSERKRMEVLASEMDAELRTDPFR